MSDKTAPLSPEVCKLISVTIKRYYDDRMIERMAHSQMTEEEIELHLLKTAVINPDLYNSIKNVFHNHPYPNALDATGKKIYRFFRHLEEEQVKPCPTPR